jgi:hypothetical protein
MMNLFFATIGLFVINLICEWDMTFIQCGILTAMLFIDIWAARKAG